MKPLNAKEIDKLRKFMRTQNPSIQKIYAFAKKYKINEALADAYYFGWHKY